MPRYQALPVLIKSLLFLTLIIVGCFAFGKVVYAFPTFGSNSSKLTNRYMPMKVGDKLTYKSYGWPATFYIYTNAIAQENIDSVKCLKVKTTTSNLPSYAEYDWYAQDTSGNIWILQYQDAESGYLEHYGSADAIMVMPSIVNVGTHLSEDETVVAAGVTVSQLSTGKGPYYNCIKTKIVYQDGDIDYQYYAPGVGIVKIEANDDGGTNGVEISDVFIRPPSMPWISLLLDDESGVIPPPTQPSWEEKAPMPTPRFSLSAGAINGKIYAIGGQSDWNVNDQHTVEEYSPATNTWITKSPMPTARSALAVGVVNGKIYAIGGHTFNPSIPAYLTTNIVEEYNPVSNTWATRASMPTPRCFFAAVSVNGKIYAIGGSSGDSDVATVEEYDPLSNTWSEKASMPTARRQLSASVANNKIYATGGYGIGGNLKVVEEYDPIANTWATKASMPNRRFDHVSASVGESIFLFGDFSGPINNIVEKYSPSTDSWSLKTPMPEGSFDGFAASVVNDKVYVIGVGASHYKVYEYTPLLDP